eukprot:6918872-Prymnesium_polylepis.1
MCAPSDVQSLTVQSCAAVITTFSDGDLKPSAESITSSDDTTRAPTMAVECGRHRCSGLNAQ